MNSYLITHPKFYSDDSGIFRSTNNGDNWIAVNNGLSVLNIFHLINDNSGNIYACSFLEDVGVFKSENYGDSWIDINTGLDNLIAMNLASSSQENIFVGNLVVGFESFRKI